MRLYVCVFTHSFVWHEITSNAANIDTLLLKDVTNLGCVDGLTDFQADSAFCRNMRNDFEEENLYSSDCYSVRMVGVCITAVMQINEKWDVSVLRK